MRQKLILGESEALLGVWWGWRGSSENEGGHGVLRGLVGVLRRLLCSLPSGKNFFKKKFFSAGFVFKKKSWAFSFKRAVFWHPSFQRKVFLKKFFARKIAEIFERLLCSKNFCTGWRRLRSQPSGSFLAAVALKCVLQKIAVIRGAAFPLKFNFFFFKMCCKKHFTSTVIHVSILCKQESVLTFPPRIKQGQF